MNDPKNAREYAKGCLLELEAGAEGLSGFVDSYSCCNVCTTDQWNTVTMVLERAEGFAAGFRCCLEMWPVPVTEAKEAAND